MMREQFLEALANAEGPRRGHRGPCQLGAGPSQAELGSGRGRFRAGCQGSADDREGGLYDAWRRSGLNKVAFAERLGIAETEVRRMVNPRHATKIEWIDAALRSLGRRLMVSVADLKSAEGA